MNCKEAKRRISGWLDGQVEDSLLIKLESHLGMCSACQKEAQTFRSFHKILFEAAPTIEPSLGFEAAFWNKVSLREKRPAFEIIFEKINALIPQPSLAQAFAVLLVAVMIGGAGGVVSAMNAPQAIPKIPGAVKSLSGFQEFNGIPKPSMAGTYLQMLEERELK